MMYTVLELVSKEFSKEKCIHIYKDNEDGSYSLRYTFVVSDKNKTILDVIYKYLSDYPTSRRILTVLPVTNFGKQGNGEVKITVGPEEISDRYFSYEDDDECCCCCGDVETKDEPMTVGKLKKLLANYPDETYVHVMTNIKEEGFTTQAITGMITMSDEDPMTIAFMSLEDDDDDDIMTIAYMSRKDDDEHEYSLNYDGPCGNGGIDHEDNDCKG